MPNARYFYAIDETSFRNFQSNEYLVGKPLSFLIKSQKHEVDEFILKGQENISFQYLNSSISNDFIDLDASFDWWDIFVNPEVGLFTVEAVKEIADYFQSPVYEKILVDSEKIENSKIDFVRVTLSKLRQFFIQTG